MTDFAFELKINSSFVTVEIIEAYTLHFSHEPEAEKPYKSHIFANLIVILNNPNTK